VLAAVFLLVNATLAVAKKNEAPSTPWPSADAQKAFTESYYQALDGGRKAFSDFEAQINNDPSADAAIKAKMLENLKKGKTPDGSAERTGFRGDPNDPGPQDWSDYIIETDANGNVTGFKDKDHYDKDLNGDGNVTDQEMQEYEAKRADQFMDKDGDGKVSDQEKEDAAKEMDKNKDGQVDDQEREDWNDQKAEEKKIADNGGQAPGEVDTPPDWDKNRDGKPDPDFVRDCWQCKQPPPELHECVDGAPGPCDSHACDQEQECVEHTETYDKVSLICHNCIPKETTPWCEERAFYSDANCRGDCDPYPCVPVDIDIKSGKVVPKMQTRERGSTQPCYICKKTITIEVTWVIVIIETPHARYILDKGKSLGAFESFVPKQVMALAKVTQSPDGVKQLAGFFPGASAGMGILNIAQSMNLEQLSGLLQQSMDKGGKYSDDCFSKDFSENNFAEDTRPPVGSLGSQPKNSKKNASPAAPTAPVAAGEFGENPKEAMTPGGPVLACGEQNGKKALAIMDAAGRPIEFLTQEVLKKSPDALKNALEKAQLASDTIMDIRSQGVEGFMKQKAQSLVQGFVDKMVKKVSDKVFDKDKEKKEKKTKAKKGKEEEVSVVPNDPYYAAPEEEERKRLLGVFGSKKEVTQVAMGSLLVFGGETLGAGSSQAKKKEEVMSYQWGLHAAGYTPLSDPQSAWNFVDEDARNVLVAVIDSGIDLNHPDGPKYIWKNEKEIAGNGIDDDQNGFVDDINGWNFLDNNNDLTDLQGHGTFVSGIIAARTNNGTGIAGINPGAVIMPIKVADSEGHTNSLHIFRAIQYAVDNGAKVINVSLGARGISELERSALNYADQMGVFVAVASGNVGENISGHGPASSKGAFAVGSLDFEGTKSTISNWGPNKGLIAPGDRILSLLATGTGKKLKPSLVKAGVYPQSGTSFSTPIVAATASLLLAKNPDLIPDQIEDILHRSAEDMYTDGWDGDSGAGKLNASNALQYVVERPLTVKITETQFNYDDNKKLESVDVYGTVRGKFSSYVVELGKGKNAGSFTQVAGPYTQPADHDWLAHLVQKETLRGSSEWILRIRATDAEGKEYIAQTLLELK
jgi:subtilisin family serine protease